MVETAVVAASRLDYTEYARLQQDAFADIAANSGTPFVQSPEYFRWKYNPPAGDAKVALIRDEEGLLAANAMYPLALRDGAALQVGWQSCDTATRPRGRGKGYFMACLKALSQQMEPGTLFFGFPNGNSIHGFRKLGWTVNAHLDAAVGAALLGGRRSTPGIVELDRFDDRQDALNHALANGGAPAIDRSAAYMTWRYLRHPLHRYACFGFEGGAGLAGVAVARLATVRSRKATLVMDLQASSRKAEKALLGTVASWGAHEGHRLILRMGNQASASKNLRQGFLPVPRRALATEHVLMGAPVGGAPNAIWSRPWRTQLGDGDGF